MFNTQYTYRQPGWTRSIALILFMLLLALSASFVATCNSDSSTEDVAVHGPGAAAKVFVTTTGVYEITSADLKSANLGWEDIGPDRLRLEHKGVPQPLWLDQEESSFTLRFYGRASTSRYARENVYWLYYDGESSTDPVAERAARRATDTSAAAATINATTTADWYTAHVRVEENRIYSPLVEEGDRWFWVSLPAPASETFTVPLTEVANGPGHLRLEAWASTESSSSPDHHLRIAVNGVHVAAEMWDGRGRYTIEAEIPAGILTTGENIVTVEAPGDTGVAADITFIDWIEIYYPRRFVAFEDQLEFTGADVPLQLTGFSGPVMVYEITNPFQAEQVDMLTPQQGKLTFTGQPGRRYLLLGPAGFRQPARIAPAQRRLDLHSTEHAVDYVAIGPPDLLEALQPLLDWRTEEGLTTLAVSVEAVYDQFGYGLAEPEALRTFLRHAMTAWERSPRYVLLVGSATYDPLGHIAPPEANRLPTFLVPTIYGGETASDIAFVQMEGKYWPEIAIGRMPARSPAQVQTMVAKTLAYEQQGAASSRSQRVLAVADEHEATFARDAQAFLTNFEGGYETTLLQPEIGASNASQKVRQEIEEGHLLVAYFGHGSVTQWGKDRLFSTNDVAELINRGQLPIMINMTCLTGLFTHPQVDSLTETLLWKPVGGAVAALAPTSLTLPTDQSFLSQALANALLTNPDARLGDMLLQAWRTIPDHGAGTRDVLQTFLLFGDPALRLPQQQ